MRTLTTEWQSMERSTPLVNNQACSIGYNEVSEFLVHRLAKPGVVMSEDGGW